MKRPPFFSITGLTDKLTLRQRIAALNGLTILILGIILVFFINLAAPLFLTNQVGVPNTIVLTQATDLAGNPVTIIEETPAPAGYIVQRFEPALPGNPLVVVKYLSAAGVILIGIAAFFVSRWMAWKSLQPIDAISRTTQSISAHTLKQRLSYQGPKDEIKVLADVFDGMLDRLERSFQDQAEFNANLAHELRTPLTALQINVENLASDPQATPEDYQEFLQFAVGNVDHMVHLVNDLLLLSSGEKEVAREPVFLGVLFEAVFDELTPLSREHNVILKMSGAIELAVAGDELLLHRALANLVENGIYYNRPGGFVEVSAAPGKDVAIIEVRDNGQGISTRQQERLFKRFSRGVGQTENHGNGKGLGLVITAHIVKIHGGNISATSEPGKGSTFHIELPLSAEQFDENS